MTNHVILCGLGELGFRTLERLRAFGEDVVVMEPRPSTDFRLQLADWKVRLIQDAGRSPQALREAGILTARAVIATSPDDLTNLAIALAAREENPEVLLVVRLFNQTMATKVEREIPHCRVLDVAALAAPVFAYAGLHQDVLHVLDVPGGRFLLRRWPGLAPAEARLIMVKRTARELFGSAAPGGIGFSVAARPDWDLLPFGPAPVTELDQSFGFVRADGGEAIAPPDRIQRARQSRFARDLKRRFSLFTRSASAPLLLLMGLLSGVSVAIFEQRLHLTAAQALYFVVTIMTTTGFGDISVKDSGNPVLLYVSALMVIGSVLMAVLYALVTDALLSVRLGGLFDRQSLPRRGHFVVFGLGTVGFRIAEELQRLGVPTIAIEKREGSRLVERARRMGVRVVVTRDFFSALGDVNLEDARCMMTVTDDDALNLEAALIAQERNPEARVVVRFFDAHLARLLERTFGVHLARSPSAIAAPAFAVAASGDELIDAFDLGNELWCAGRLDVAAGHPLEGLPPARLAAHSILVLTRRRGEGPWEPSSEIPLLAGDGCVVVTLHEVWLRLQRNEIRPGAGPGSPRLAPGPPG